MSGIPIDIINRLSNLQSQIWQTVSLTSSESCGQAVTFGNPLVVSTKAADMYGELSAPMMVIQFAFASNPEDTQVILLPEKTVLEVASLVQGTTVDDIDENTVADLRGILESIVQGICLSVGNIRNDPVVASGLTIRFQIFSFPPNLQKADQIARVQIAITGDDLNGSGMWLFSNETAHEILGAEIEEEDTSIPFDQADEGQPFFNPAAFAGARGVGGFEEPSSLDLLMDIPLEISVELGRVKMLVKDVVELGTGSIVEIDKAAGEPVDVMVNGRLVARGEVVVIEDNFGVRITEIINPAERMGRADAA